MIIRKDIILTNHNSLALDCYAKNLTKLKDISELSEFKNILAKEKGRKNFLGTGSKIIFSGDLDGLTVVNQLRGIDIIKEDADSVVLGVNAGEKWDKFVEWTIQNKFYGLENLSGMRGTVAGAVIRNTEQFGLRCGDFIENVITIELELNKDRKFSREECKFDYHQSIFSNELKSKIFIYRVIFRLLKKNELKTNYREIKQGLMLNENAEITPELIRSIVLRHNKSRESAIRFPNAGTIFKNPVIAPAIALKLKDEFSDLVLNKIGEEEYKIPAGWLIKKAGWVGQKMGNAGLYKDNPAILINLGKAKPMDFIVLINAIKSDIAEKFGVELEEEIEII